MTIPNGKRQSAVTKAKESPPNTLRSVAPWKPEDKAALAITIGRVFDLQKQCGKQVGQLENIIDGFCWAMQSYSAQDVIHGFGQYILRNSDMPTPSDIVKIIDPQPAPWKPDKAFYISLKQIYRDHGPYGLDSDEIEYIQRYEEHERTQMRQA